MSGVPHSRADTANKNNDRQAFQQFFEQLLMPLMPVAIQCGVSALELTTATRAIYIRAVEARLSEGGQQKVTDARLALLTGLPRSEVARARAGVTQASAVDDLDESLRNIGTVLNLWHTDSAFSGAYGLPLDLDLEPNPERPGRSFAALIEKASPALSAPVTIDDLVAKGVAETVGGTLVRCRARTVLPERRDTGLLPQYGRFLANAAGTVAHNILRRDEADGFFDRLMISDVPLSGQSLRSFHARAMSDSDAMLHQLDTWLSKLPQEATGKFDRRGGVGVFFFSENHVSNAPALQKEEFQRALDDRGSAENTAE
jgi:hypothetical protein